MRNVSALFTTLLLAAVAASSASCTPHAAQARSIDTTSIAKDCPACKDFFTYANEGWIKRTTIPADYPAYDGFYETYDASLIALHGLLDTAAKNAKSSSDANEQKIGAFYAACMDSTRENADGLKPLAPLMAAIDSIGKPADIAHVLAELHLDGIGAGFAFSNESDPKDSKNDIGQMYQGGLGLPDRDYYTKTDPKSDSIKKDYVAHVGRMLGLSGMSSDSAKKAADRVMALETSLAKASMTLVAQRDPKAIYHKMTVADLGKLAPSIDWMAYFKAMGVADLASPTATLDVSQPDFYKYLNQAITTTPIADWKAYLRWQVLNAVAPIINDAFFAENFAFQKELSGQEQPRPRWKRCVSRTDASLGEALGKVYVDHDFTPQAKQRMVDLVNNLQAVFSDRISKYDWMSDSTKAHAKDKLTAFLKKIAYPDKWRDYSALKLSADDPFVTSTLAANRFEVERQAAKIDKPVDRMEWGMTPPTVNAYYNALNNEIVFPAGILAPPFFDPNAEDAINYGGIGMVIGHEMTHGFDDQGSQYDKEGNLKDWWTPEDAKKFKALAGKVVDQYNSYLVVDTMHVNGALTLGENIADIGGLTLAYYAYERSLQGKAKPPVIDGFTAEQRFFIGAAQAWHSKEKPEYLRLNLTTDVHSPDKWRINGAVSNMPEFAAAFSCKDGDPMVLPAAKRGAIW